MSDVRATPQPWTGPGIIESFISLRQDSELTQETLERWFDDYYVPALLKTGVVETAWRFRAANPEFGRQYMNMYKVSDLGQAGTLKSIPRTSELFPTIGPVDDFIELESRTYSFVQLYETQALPEDAATTIVYAAMQPSPGGEADLDAWYREEHNQQMSEQPGWIRTTRYSLLSQQRSDDKTPEGLSFLAIHEFGEGHRLGKNVEPLDPITEWTKKCMSEAKAIDAAIYNKVKTLGKAAET